MYKNILRKISEWTAFGVIVALLAFVAQPFTASAILVTSPPRTINTGDITSDTILDETITATDIKDYISLLLASTTLANLTATSTTNISGSLTLPTGSITSAFILNNSINGSDIAAGASTTLDVLNVATLNATSSLNVYGPLTATGTTTFNGLGLKFPASNGASGTAMLSNGFGGLSFGEVTDKWQRLLSTTTEATMSELTIDLSTASSTHMQVMFFWPSQVGNGTGAMRFNNDAGASMYYSRTSYNNAADSTGVGAAIELTRTSGSTDGANCIIDIVNIRSQNKAPKWSCSTSPVAIGTPNRFEGVGLWPVSTSTISSIQFRGDAGAATSFVAGSVITVWGSDN